MAHIESVGARCASTAMVVLMHYAAVSGIEAHGPQDVRRAIARGDHLSSLALSEVGSRSHFWTPLGTATTAEGDTVQLDARKSNAALSLGIMEALVAEAGAHLARTKLQHLGQTLAEMPVPRAAFARLRVRTDEVRAFLRDTLAALSTGRDDATLRTLEVKAVAAEAAAEVADGVLRLCGGATFRKELGVERLFRDALAARAMAPPPRPCTT